MSATKRVGLYQINVPNGTNFWGDSVISENVWADSLKNLRDGRTTLSLDGQIVATCPKNGVVGLLWWEKEGSGGYYTERGDEDECH